MITLDFVCGQDMTAEIRKKLDRAIDKAYRNILDTNTDENAKRTVTLKITMKPDYDLHMIELTAEVTAKTAQEKALETFCQMDPDQISIEGIHRMYHEADPQTGEVADE